MGLGGLRPGRWLAECQFEGSKQPKSAHYCWIPTFRSRASRLAWLGPHTARSHLAAARIPSAGCTATTATASTTTTFQRTTTLPIWSSWRPTSTYAATWSSSTYADPTKRIYESYTWQLTLALKCCWKRRRKHSRRSRWRWGKQQQDQHQRHNVKERRESKELQK